MYVNHNKRTPYTKEIVLDMLATNDAWVERALVVLYQRQTRDEQSIELTKYKNDIGFQVADAEWFTRLAVRVMQRAQQGIPEGKRLTQSELAYARRPWARGKQVIPAIAKYRGQIVAIIEEKAAQKAGARN